MRFQGTLGAHGNFNLCTRYQRLWSLDLCSSGQGVPKATEARVITSKINLGQKWKRKI